MKMSDKDLTIAFISFYMEKKASIDNLMELFKIDEDEAIEIIETLLKRRVIFNFDFSKREMDCISKDDFDNLIKTTGKSAKELIEKYCVFNPKMSIDGTLREIEETTISEELIEQALLIAVDIGLISTSILQRVLKIGFHRAIQVLDWMKEHNYIDDNVPERNVLIDREFYKKLYPKLSFSPVPLNIFRAFDTNYRYSEFIDRLGENKRELEKRFFDNIKAVTFEDIINLSKNDFNIVRSEWLYDWNKLTGCNDFDKIEKLIEKRKEEGIDI